MSDEALKRLAEEARDAAQRCDYAAAARMYERVAAAAPGLRNSANLQAADAWRRADSPRQALSAARSLGAASTPERVVAALAAGSALMELGRLDAAEQEFAAALMLTDSAALRTVVLDAACGLALTLGDLSRARRLADELDRVAPPPARPAVAFREASLKRLGGDLVAAEVLLQSVEEAADDKAAWVGPLAAAHHERGEIALLCGRLENAMDRFRTAEQLWTSVRRDGPASLSRSGLIRTELAARRLPSPTSLCPAVAAARTAGAKLREADLRTVRGMLRSAHGISGAEEDLDAAVSSFESMKARLREGRARARRRMAGFLHADQDRTRRCLEGDVVWSGRYG